MKTTSLGDRIFSRPAFLAQPPRKGRKGILDVLITLLLLIIASTAQSIVLLPIQLFYLFKNLDLSEAGVSAGGKPDIEGTLEKVTAALNDLPPWVTVLSLFLFITITLTVYLCRVKIEKGTPESLGFYREGAVKPYLIGLAAGAGIFGLAVALGVLTGGLRFGEQSSPSLENWGWIALFFAGFLVQGMGEEALCRGYLMTALTRRNNRLTAVLVNAVFFAALHLGNSGLSFLAVINLILFGIFASLLMFKTGNLWMAAALHSMWNFVQGNLFGISVSGSAEMPSVFRAEMTDAVLWNGGDFGMEGGLCVTVVLLAGTVLLALWQPKHDRILPDASAEAAAPANM